MKNAGLSVARCCALAVCVSGAALAQAPTLSLKAVRINPFCVGGVDAGALCRGDDDCASGVCGVAISPTNDVSIVPGDVLACDLFISNWSPQGERLMAFQVEVDPGSFTSGPCGRVGVYDAPRACDSDSDCNDLNVACTLDGRCNETNPDSIFIDDGREDYLYLDRGGLAVPNTGATRWGGIVLNAANAPLYEPPPKYAGTLRLTADDDASGRFTISFVSPAVNVLATSLTDTNNGQIGPLELEPLIVNVVAAACAGPDPPNCWIDVRQFAEPDLSSPAGLAYLDLHFANLGSPDSLGLDDFSVSQIPTGSPRIAISSIESNPDDRGPEWVRVHFGRNISPQRWTCVTVLLTDQEFCISHFPADLNRDRLADPSDGALLMDRLRIGCAGCVSSECDIDRSGVCDPKDLLRLVDLLGGADMYDAWNGRTLIACPTAP